MYGIPLSGTTNNFGTNGTKGLTYTLKLSTHLLSTEGCFPMNVTLMTSLGIPPRGVPPLIFRDWSFYFIISNNSCLIQSTKVPFTL